MATLREQFGHVALTAETGLVDDPRNEGGNLVVIASDEPIDVAGLRDRLETQVPGWEVVEGADLAAWAGDAPILTDDYAPGRPAAHPALTFQTAEGGPPPSRSGCCFSHRLQPAREAGSRARRGRVGPTAQRDASARSDPSERGTTTGTGRFGSIPSPWVTPMMPLPSHGPR